MVKTRNSFLWAPRPEDVVLFLRINKLVSQRSEFRRPHAELQSLRAIQAEATQDFSGNAPFLIFSPGPKATQSGEGCHGDKRAYVSYAQVARICAL